MENTLYFGDNLAVLREYIPDESVDLIYLDPPFNSKASYNILFKEPTGEPSGAQITAFEDTWHWTQETEEAFSEIVDTAPPKVVEMMRAFRSFVGANDVMAYLTMMCIRLLELRRVLKDTGSIYLHCDPTAGHYLKVLMDAVFGKKNFLNEVIWCYKERELSKRYWNKKHDNIFFYAKNIEAKYVFNYEELTEEYSPVTLAKFKYEDEKGRFMVRGRNIKGSPIQRADGLTLEHEKKYPGLTYRKYLGEGTLPRDWWPVNIINKAAKERLGYPTQKPEALLERIIKASSRKGDVVLDPFCGCGTTVAVAQRLKRKWIGIDITHLAVTLIKWRLQNTFKGIKFKVTGEPADFTGALALAKQNRYQFQWWALSLLDARPHEEKKKGADRGIDGYIYFTEQKGKIQKIIVSVKSGKVSVRDIRDLGHVIEREEAPMGILVTLESPTKDMLKEAAEKGFYHSDVWSKEKKFPRLQVIMIKDLLRRKKPLLPPMVPFFKEAQAAEENENMEMF